MAVIRSDITDIGPWSAIKLAIIREYAGAYSRILAAQSRPPLEHVYIDAFAGAGLHASRVTGNLVYGSPAVALLTDPPFCEYHFIDFAHGCITTLQQLIHSGTAGDVDLSRIYLYNADCNDVLLRSVFPRVRFESFRRALCLLDPYGLDLNWEVVQTAGEMRSIELFLNFPVHDMNRNVLHHDPAPVSPEQVDRMTRFWGDASWREVAYSRTGNLFGYEEKLTNADLVRAYRKRLQEVAGFQYVPDPIPMRNSTGATVYYLFFASQKPVAGSIVSAIFRKYRDR